MEQNDVAVQDLNRRDFLKSGSTATLMTMLGGVRMFARADEAAAAADTGTSKIRVAVVGLGSWGREILKVLGRLPRAEVAAICDTYPAYLRRCASLAPGAAQTQDYRTLLADAKIRAVVVATPTHRHKDVVLAALQAGKHVYCEAPLAHTLEDARAIALAARARPELIFQAGLQLRCDIQRRELVRTFRTGALGRRVMGRAQWHKKQSWRGVAPTPEREQELNWRLARPTSSGLMGEIGGHTLDQACWFFDQLPLAVTGFGAVMFWEDGREVPDTIQVRFDFPERVSLFYDATLANSFDEEYELYYGSDSAVLLRQSDIWLFKEVDSKLLGWEVYFPKQQFYRETGIVLKVGASKSVPTDGAADKAQPPAETPLFSALNIFTRNAADFEDAREDFVKLVGDDPESVKDHLATSVPKRPAPGFLEGYQAAVTGIKANEAILGGERIVLKPEWYALG